MSVDLRDTSPMLLLNLNFIFNKKAGIANLVIPDKHF